MRKGFLALLAAGCVAFGACSDGTGPSDTAPADVPAPDAPADVLPEVPAEPACGNHACEAGEDCLGCPGDCDCRCGDGVCTLGEACRTCPADCDCTTPSATPPMGWNSWNSYGCFIFDSAVRDAADTLVASGMRDAGYEFVNIDDCWQIDRAADGTILVQDGTFPGGLKELADYVHAAGLKIGNYTCAGTMTCAKRPGSLDHEAQDMATYASWGIDYVKVDWCNTEGQEQAASYAKFRDAIAASGRPMVLSICEWGSGEPWVWGPRTGQLWRTTGDIAANYASIVSNIQAQERYAAAARPGHWNDPDMLEIGNGYLTPAENRSHLALWAVSAAPFIAGNVLADMDDATRALLVNPEAIAVDQDPAGVQGVKVVDGAFQAWARPVTLAGGRAVVLFNPGEAPVDATVRWSDLGLAAGPARVRDLLARRDLGTPQDAFTATVPPHDSVFVLIQGTEPLPPAGDSYVSDLPWVHSAAFGGPVERDRANGGAAAGDGPGLSLRGEPFPKGLGTHASALVLVHLGGRCSRFQADVGLDDTADAAAEVAFQVSADGKPLFDSGRVTTQDPARAVDVALDGARELRLFVEPTGRHAAGHLADWANARITCR